MLTESRGVLASYANVTPIRTDDPSKWKLSIRDVVLLLIGCAGMYGAQIARDSSMNAKMDRIGDKIDAAISTQGGVNDEFRRELDRVRGRAELGVVLGNEAKAETAKLEGMLIGAGVKGVKRNE